MYKRNTSLKKGSAIVYLELCVVFSNDKGVRRPYINVTLQSKRVSNRISVSTAALSKIAGTLVDKRTSSHRPMSLLRSLASYFDSYSYVDTRSARWKAFVISFRPPPPARPQTKPL